VLRYKFWPTHGTKPGERLFYASGTRIPVTSISGASEVGRCGEPPRAGHTQANSRTGATVSIEVAGALPSGAEVSECRLTNRFGVQACILTLGATLRTLLLPDERGELGDVVLGFDTVEDYLRGSEYFGATIGRYANRIAGGRFSLAGQTFQLACNSAPNAEHGGEEGFNRRLWSIEATDVGNGAAAVSLSLVSPDGDQGYPGELAVHLTYTLTNSNELRIDYTATTSATTVVNLTNHSYWNLSGGGDGLAARLCIEADAYTPVNEHLIPTGELCGVAGTAFDFRRPRVIGARIRDGSDSQLLIGHGYDHNFVLRGPPGSLRSAARLEEPRSGRVLELLTTEPGLQLYTGNFLRGAVAGKGRRLYRQGEGIALEPQHFPDSPNQPRFPSTVLEAGRLWTSTTVYRFLTTTAQVPHGPEGADER
jgi:aldose 1-epimerase